MTQIMTQFKKIMMILFLNLIVILYFVVILMHTTSYWAIAKSIPKEENYTTVFLCNDIFLLNDGSGTRVNPINFQNSCLDLNFTSVNIIHKFKWQVDTSSTCGSSHYPIQLSSILVIDNINVNHYFSWNFKKAKWKQFINACDVRISEDLVSDNIDESNHNLTEELVNIATEFIPVKSFTKRNKPCVPGWNEECSKVVKIRNKARNKAQHSVRGGFHHL